MGNACTCSSSNWKTGLHGSGGCTGNAAEEETDWFRLGGGDLEDPLRSGLIRLVRADWLVALARTGGRLVRRQALPEEAFVGLDELKEAGSACIEVPEKSVHWEWLRVIVLSHPWLQPRHPDAHGENLRFVARALEAFVEDSLWDEDGGNVVVRWPYVNGGKPYGVLIDYTSLHQEPRTDKETADFKLAVLALSRFYSHPHTVLLKVTSFPYGYPTDPAHPYELPPGANTVAYGERGWCYAEAAMGGLVKASSTVLDLDKLTDDTALAAIINAGHGRRPHGESQTWISRMSRREPPWVPSEFRKELDRKSFTSKKGDFDKVAQLYADAFAERIGRATVLDYSGSGWGADAVRDFVQVLQWSEGLQSLDLSGNDLDSEAAALLAEALKRNASLTSLRLGGNHIGADGTKVLCTALKTNHTLTSLELDCNGLGAEGARSMSEVLRQNHSLRVLELARNSVGGEGAKALGEALKRHHALTSLQLNSNHAGFQGARAFGEALKHNHSLNCLNLSNNGLGREGVQALAEGLQRNATLESLSLAYNDVGMEGARALAEALRRNRTLTALCLYECSVSDAGAKELARVLRSNCALTLLDFGRNRVGPEGTKALAEALTINSVLAVLNLGDATDAGGKGLRELVQASLQDGGQRPHLEAQRNCVGREGARALVQALCNNGKLTKLNVPPSEIGDEEVRALQQAAEVRSRSGGEELVIDPD